MNQPNDQNISYELVDRLAELCCHCHYLCLEGNSGGAEMKKRDYVAECTHPAYESQEKDCAV